MLFLKAIIKSIIILAAVLVMVSPLLLDMLTYKRDIKRKISHKRFRLVVFTAVYAIAVTVALILLKEMLIWLGDLDFVRWVARKIALSSRQVYFIKIFAVMIVNFLIGLLYRLLCIFVRIGLKRKNLTTPKKNGEFSWAQKAERGVIRFFCTETWFFVAGVLKYLCTILTVIYSLVFVTYQIPAIFGADWIPYDFISMLFEAGYVFPTITLLVLWQMYFFLGGLQRIEDECPEFKEEPVPECRITEADLLAIDEEVRKQFSNFYACDVDISGMVRDDYTYGEHHPITQYISQAVERDKRNPHISKEVYLDCTDKLFESEKSLLINGNFHSEFSAYFLRYLSTVVARGDNIVLVCNSEAQIQGVYEYLTKGLAEISSLFCKGFRGDAVDYDDPLWRIVRVSGEHDDREEASIEDSNILVTSLGYLCSDRFEREYDAFVSRIDTVIFVDTLNTINTFGDQMSILNARFKHITKKNAIRAGNKNVTDIFRLRYLSRQIRYICFDDTRVAGLDKVLKNMLSVEFESVDAMKYNAQTIVRCYNYEARPDDFGRRECKQFISSAEEVGPLMNIAILCLAKGASNVTVFLDDVVPYEKIAETLAANSGQITLKVDEEKIRINKQFYNPDDYSVIIAMDSGNNLPTALRKYIAMASDKPTLVLLFSRPYMLRDYYTSHADKLWSFSQIERIPVEEGTKKDVAQRILIKANFGGISKSEILRMATKVPQFSTYVQNKNVDAILRAALEVYGVPQEDRLNLFKYFEYYVSHEFDTNGKFQSEDMVVLRRRGRVFETINGHNMVMMHTPMGEMQMPIPRSRVTQNYIAEQNLVHNGEVYHIHKVDPAAGRIYANLAVGDDKKQVYQYLQDREYRVRAEQMEKVFPTKHMVVGREAEDIGIQDAFIAVFRAPTEVLTRGYYEISPYTLAAYSDDSLYHSISDPGNDDLAKQSYRRYGNIEDPVYSSESVMRNGDPVAFANGALMMSIRFRGKFGPDTNKTVALAATMLNELLHNMFPSVADALVVCPVLDSAFTKTDAAAILGRQPKLTLMGNGEAFADGEFALVIIEDAAEDLGVISALMSAGNDIMRTLFEPIYDYLGWYLSAGEKSEYLRFGLPEEPACFDFPSLYKLAAVIGDKKHDMRFVDIETLIERETCDFCGKRYPKSEGMIELEDGRIMCKHCADNLVGNNKKALKAHLERAKRFLENTYGIKLDDDYDFCFESTVKIANTLKHNRDLVGRGSDLPLKSYVDDKKKVHIEYSVPSANLSELLVRELTHVWQLKHVPEVAEELAEGHIALVGIQYLRFLNENGLAAARTNYYESAATVSGEGYRKLVRQLLLKPQYSNNPFRYLLEACGQTEDVPPKPTPRVIEEGELGPQYTPEKPDRTTGEEVASFYHHRLTESRKKAYETILTAVRNYDDKVDVPGFNIDEVRTITDAVAFDHPELFYWVRHTLKMRGSELQLCYGVSAEEAQVLQRRIDEVVPKYLEGITDSMSAYDVALRLHTKIIAMVDYDTLALNEETRKGGPADDKIDMLRTICGVFLNKKAVCEGYARALQYLLQKCGIECAEAAGHIRKENGETEGGHAWNIVKIDGDYYYIDTTWDDGSNTVQTVKSMDPGFNYFCITTEELLRTRDLSLSPVEMPDCSAVRANYFYHNGLVVDDYDATTIKELAKKAAANHGKSFCFKCKSKAVYDMAYQRLCIDGEDCFDALKAAAKEDKQILTSSYSYKPDKNIYTITIQFKYK